MNKAELIAAIASDSGLTKSDAEKALNAYIAAVTKALKSKKKVVIPGFMSAENRPRKASTGRNPRTGEKIKIPAKNIPKLKAGKTLTEALN